MSCSDYTNNNRPIGIGYDSRNRPRSFSELSGITVSSVSATGGVHTSSIFPGGVDLTIYGRVSATAFLGAGGGGATEFIGLADVDPTTVLTPGSLVVVSEGAVLTTADPIDVLGGFQPSSTVLTTISDTSIPSGQESVVVFSNEVAATTTEVGSVGKAILNANTAGAAKTALNITFNDLTDTQNYSGGNANNIVIVNSAGTGVVLVPSSILTGGGGVTDHGALTGLLDNDHTQYVLSATNTNLSSLVGGHIGDGSVHFTSASLESYYAASSWVAANYSPTSHTHPQYATTATVNTLSSTVTSHIADGTIHFTSGSLSSVYASAGHNHALSSLTDTSISSPVTLGSILKWNGFSWYAEPPVLGTGTRFSDLEGVASEFIDPTVVSSMLIDGSPLVWNTASSLWAGKDLPDWVEINLTPELLPYLVATSGGDYPANFVFSSLSATRVSATDVYIGGSDGHIINNSGKIVLKSSSGITLSSTVDDFLINGQLRSTVAAIEGASFIRKNEHDIDIGLVATVLLPMHTLDSSIHFTSGSLVSHFSPISHNHFLSALSDVSSLTPVNKDILIYNSSVGRYVGVPIPPKSVSIHSDATANITLTNQPNTEQFLANSNRNIHRSDLRYFTEVRILVRVVTGSVSVNTPRIYVEYSPTFATAIGSYINIGTSPVSASLTTAGFVTSPWVELESGARGDVFFTVLQHGGDGVADPALGPITVEFR